MITRELESFVITAKTGSFQRASEQLFISSTALIKQINALEAELDIKLFHRTNRGIQLTPAGTVFYDVASDILHRYYEGVQTARNLHEKQTLPIRLGISPINPYCHFPKAIAYQREFFNDLSKFIIPINGDYKSFYEELQNLGTNVDLIPYFLGDPSLDACCDSFCLAKLPLRVAVPINHPLAQKSVLTYDDLNGQALHTISSEANRYYRQFNEDILARSPGVQLHLQRHYDPMVLNCAANYQHLILAGDYLKDAHPMLKFLPVNWDHVLPYGLYYAREGSDAVRSYLQAFRQSGITGHIEDAHVVEL